MMAGGPSGRGTITAPAEGRRRIAGFPLLYVAMFVMATGNLAMISLFPAIARSSGIPDVAMVAVQSVSAGLSIIAMPFWAARSDTIGRKQVILIGIAGFTLASALTAGAIFAAVHRLVPIVAGIAALVGSRAVFGGVGLASAPAIQAHIADETLPVQRTEALASLYSAQGLGSIVGPGLAPFLILPWVGLSGPLITFAIIGAVVLAAVAWQLPRTAARVPAAGRGPGKWATLRLASVWPFVAYLAVLSGCQAAGLQMLGFVVIDRLGLAPLAAQPLAGGAMMLGAAAGVTVQLGIMRRLRTRPDRLMLAGALLMVLGNVLMALAGHYALVVLAFIVASAGAAFGMPAAAAGASLANSGDRQGAVAGMTSAALGSGLLVAPVVAMLIYRHSDAAAFLALAGALALALVMLLPRARRCLAASGAPSPPSMQEARS